MIEANEREVDLLGEAVEYDVRHSSDATKPRIDVDIHGITVVLPDATNLQPATLLEEKASWVLEKQRKYDRYREQIPDRRYEDGATFPYLDDPHEVIVERRPYSSVVDGSFRLTEHHANDTSVKRALETLYRRKARETFERIAETYATEMGVEFEKIEIRNQRTKWGSCSTSGTLSLNWRLMMAPREIVEYIVVHELAHLREPNHSDTFWSLVADHDPEYEAHARWLDENSARLVFSEEDL